MQSLAVLPRGFSGDRKAVNSIDEAIRGAVAREAPIDIGTLPEYARKTEFLEALYPDWFIHESYNFPSLLHTLVSQDQQMSAGWVRSYKGIEIARGIVPIRNLVVTQGGIEGWKAEKFVRSPQFAGYPIQVLGNIFEKPLHPHLLSGNTRTSYLWSEGIMTVLANIIFPLMDENDSNALFNRNFERDAYERESYRVRGESPPEAPAIRGIRGMWVIPDNGGAGIPAEVYFRNIKEKLNAKNYRDAAKTPFFPEALQLVTAK